MPALQKYGDILSLVFAEDEKVEEVEEKDVTVRTGRKGIKNIDGYVYLHLLIGTEHSLARAFKEVQKVPIKTLHLYRNKHGRYWVSSNDEEANSIKVVENWADFAFDEMFDKMVYQVAKIEKKNEKIGK
jgi:hypothetical protein